MERVDVRVVACTNRDLVEEARAGRFREDLYYRLAVVDLVVPPLREHREDIPALAAEFARRYAERFGMQDVRFQPELLDSLQRLEWPGNVRQLENAVARIVALSTGGEIGLEAFAAASAAPAADADAEAPPEGTLSLREQLDAVERSLIRRTMAAAGGNAHRAPEEVWPDGGALSSRSGALRQAEADLRDQSPSTKRRSIRRARCASWLTPCGDFCRITATSSTGS